MLSKPRFTSTRRFFRRTYPLIAKKKHITKMAVSTGLSMAKIGMDLLFANMLTELFRAVNKNEDADFLGMKMTPMIMTLMIGLVWFTSNLSIQARDFVTIPLGQEIGNELAEIYIGKIMNEPYIHYQEKQLSDRFTTFFRGRFSTPGMITQGLSQVIPTTVNTLIASSVLTTKYGAAGLGIIPFVTIYAIYSAYTTKFVINKREQAIQAGNKLFENLERVLANRETIDIFNNIKYELDKLSTTLQNGLKAEIDSTLIVSKIGIGQSIIAGLGLTSILMYFADGVSQGKYKPDDFILVFSYLSQFFLSLYTFGPSINQLLVSIKDVDTVYKELEKHTEVVDRYPDNKLEISHEKMDIEFKRVMFFYKENEAVLKNISFKILQGQKICFVGPSGSGKSTLAKLPFRFYDVSGGEILINGKNINEVSLGSLRDYIGIVPQSPVLFNGTLRSNLVYGRQTSEVSVTDDELNKVLHDVGLEELIPKLDDEKFGELSGGQKQRVAIARVLLKKPKIIIADEATSALDATTEPQVQKVMDDTFKNATTLVITHRLDAAKNADQIFVLKKGEIVEHGTHHELLKEDGLYAELWKKQKGKAKKELSTGEHKNYGKDSSRFYANSNGKEELNDKEEITLNEEQKNPGKSGYVFKNS